MKSETLLILAVIVAGVAVVVYTQRKSQPSPLAGAYGGMSGGALGGAVDASGEPSKPSLADLGFQFGKSEGWW